MNRINLIKTDYVNEFHKSLVEEINDKINTDNNNKEWITKTWEMLKETIHAFHNINEIVVTSVDHGEMQLDQKHKRKFQLTLKKDRIELFDGKETKFYNDPEKEYVLRTNIKRLIMELFTNE